MPDLPHLVMLQCDIEDIMAAVDPCAEQCDDARKDSQSRSVDPRGEFASVSTYSVFTGFTMHLVIG